jgi:spore coat polysaccharide biosynthesis protein SpsF
MDSRRLPGKVLADLAGTPLLGHLLQRLVRCTGLDAVIVATSDRSSDDEIADFCEGFSVSIHRGSLDDVAARFADASTAHRLDAFVRVSADSPLLDRDLVGTAALRIRTGGADVVSNVYPQRTYPRGQSVEAVRTDALMRSLPLMTTADDHEHVTPGLYRHPELFRIEPMTAPTTYPATHLAVDAPDDLRRMRTVIERMERPSWEYGLDEVLALWQGAA